MMVTAIDLFCGVGGLTHGLIKGGVRVAAGVDLDPACRFPYEENNDARFIQGDVHDLAGDDLRKLWGKAEVTLLAGCAPCQPFSTYSRSSRQHKPDSKWGLVADFARLVSESSPDLVTMENVPQLRGHEVFSDFVRSLAGYHVWHSIVECAQFGVPQTRKRLVLLASRIGPVELDASSLIDDEATVRKAISHLPALAAGESDPNDELHAACNLSRLNLQRIKASRPGGTWRDWKPSLVADCHRQESGGTYPSVYGRMEWDAPAPTITTQSFGYGNGRFGHPEQNRAITLREAAILQTFPPSYRFIRKGESLRFHVLGRLIGNAVPVRLGEVVAEAITKHLSLARRRRTKETSMRAKPGGRAVASDPTAAMDRMTNLARRLLAVPKAAVDAALAKEKAAKKKTK